MSSQIAGQVVGIKKSILEKSLEYLACPFDKGDLELYAEDTDIVRDGEFRCTICKRIYPIKEGVPYFGKINNGFEWKNNVNKEEVIKEIISSVEDLERTLYKISSLGDLFLHQSFGDRKKAIDKIFQVLEEVFNSADLDTETQARLLQAGTAARYDIEIYRGTFKLPSDISKSVQENFVNGSEEAIVEGACATGDCLLELAEKIDSKFYLGIDISGNLIREAQKKASDNMLFVQGDITILPLKYNSSCLYIINNVLDRVVDPYLACQEADRILCRNKSQLVISNCQPLQFEYKTTDGEIIKFVPENKRLSIEDAMNHVGFNIAKEVQGEGEDGWKISTAAFGDENLPFLSIAGKND